MSGCANDEGAKQINVKVVKTKLLDTRIIIFPVYYASQQVNCSKGKLQVDVLYILEIWLVCSNVS